MSGYIDLHLHTDRSDGALAPADLLEIVRKKKLAAFAITDHDTLDGYRAVRQLLTEGDPELIAGVELSVDAEGDDMHMLAYLFDPEDSAFKASLQDFQNKRNQRVRLMVEKLNRLGVDITFEDVRKAGKGPALGRPHVAQAMLDVGAIDHFDVAFRKYIGNACVAYVPKTKMTPAETIKLIHAAGGIAVLAHPCIGDMVRHVEKLVDLGLDGLEVYHYAHNRQDISRLKKLCARYRLVLSGGSDYHGRHEREGEVGAQQVPADLLVGLKQKAQSIRGTA